MSVDLSDFEALERRKGPSCAIGVALSTLPAGKRSKLQAALAHTTDVPGQKAITSRAIMRWLRDQQVKVGEDTVRRHRRRECACDQD